MVGQGNKVKNEITRIRLALGLGTALVVAPMVIATTAVLTTMAVGTAVTVAFVVSKGR